MPLDFEGTSTNVTGATFAGVVCRARAPLMSPKIKSETQRHKDTAKDWKLCLCVSVSLCLILFISSQVNLGLSARARRRGGVLALCLARVLQSLDNLHLGARARGVC